MNLFNLTKPSIASLKVRVVHFGNDGKPVYAEPECPVNKQREVHRAGGIVKERVIPVPGFVLRTIVETEN